MNRQDQLLKDKDVQKFIGYIAEKLVVKFDVSPKEAMSYIYDSSFIDTLKNDPDFVFHYSSSYWAKHIINEHEFYLEPVY
ncbi:D-alanine--D-alanine ligase [Bacillus cereus Rock4-18]|nr:D-alanine--D-alanine ligase [Bacillus cereus Rock4-18]